MNNTLLYDTDVWNKLSIGDRVEMLNQLIDCIGEANCQHLERHIADRTMKRFLSVENMVVSCSGIEAIVVVCLDPSIFDQQHDQDQRTMYRSKNELNLSIK